MERMTSHPVALLQHVKYCSELASYPGPRAERVPRVGLGTRLIHYNTSRAAKEQPDVTSYVPCILSLACNWSIATELDPDKQTTLVFYSKYTI